MSSATDEHRESAPAVTRTGGGRRRVAELGGLAVVALVLGFVQTGYVLVSEGAGADTDALFLAAAVPQLLLAIVSVAAVSVVVPLLVQADDAERATLRWTFTAVLTAVFALLAIALLVAAPALASVLGAGLDASAHDLVVSLLRIQALGMVFNAAGTMAAACGQARGDYRRPAVATLVGAAVSLGVVLAYVPEHGVAAAAWAEVMRYGVTLALMLACLGTPVRPDLRRPAVREAGRRMLPLVAGGAYYRSEVVVDRVVASLAPAGGLSVFAFVQRVYAAGAQVVQNAVAVPAFSELSGRSGAGFELTWRRAAGAGAKLAVAGWAAVAVAALVVREPLAGLGGLDPGDTDDIAVAVVLLGGVLVGGVLGQVFSSAHYARGDTRTPATIGVVGFTVGVALKVVAVVAAGIPGLALATSASLLGNAWASRRALERVPG